MVDFLQHRASHTSFTDEVASHSRDTLKRNVVETVQCTSAIKPRVLILFSYYVIRVDRANAVPRKLEPRKLILTTVYSISRKFPPTKITRYTVCSTENCPVPDHTHKHYIRKAARASAHYTENTQACRGCGEGLKSCPALNSPPCNEGGCRRGPQSTWGCPVSESHGHSTKECRTYTGEVIGQQLDEASKVKMQPKY